MNKSRVRRRRVRLRRRRLRLRRRRLRLFSILTRLSNKSWLDTQQATCVATHFIGVADPKCFTCSGHTNLKKALLGLSIATLEL